MRYSKITSVSNQHIKDAIHIREKRAKYKHEAFLIEGPHLVEMALAAGILIREVFVSEAFMAKLEYQNIRNKIAKSAVTVFEVPEQVLHRLTDTETPQGIAAIAGYLPKTLNELPCRANPFYVVLDAVQDPGNMGTIIRTADAAGVDAVILLPGCCDAFNPKAIRSTAGSIFTISIVYTEPETLLPWLNKRKIHLAVTDANTDKTIFRSDLKEPLAITFGNEAHGISKQLKEAADLVIAIPILGKAESLNVATSAAICLYECVRQRTDCKR